MRYGTILLALLAAAVFGVYLDEPLLPDRSSPRLLVGLVGLFFFFGMCVLVAAARHLRGERGEVRRLIGVAGGSAAVAFGVAYAYDVLVARKLEGWPADAVRTIVLAVLFAAAGAVAARGLDAGGEGGAPRP